ncbi:TIF4A-3, partial [Symbiodinium pilosum]
AVFGNKGVVINFLTAHDMKLMKDIERFCHIRVDEMPELSSFNGNAGYTNSSLGGG